MLPAGTADGRYPRSAASTAAFVMPYGYLRYASVTRSPGFTRYDATVAGMQATNSEIAERLPRATAGPPAARPLTRVHFTPDDLLLTRFGPARHRWPR